MDNVELKRPICLGGTEYRAGRHAMSEEHLAHWMVKGMLQDGDAVLVSEPKAEGKAPEPAPAPAGPAPAAKKPKAKAEPKAEGKE